MRLSAIISHGAPRLRFSLVGVRVSVPIENGNTVYYRCAELGVLSSSVGRLRQCTLYNMVYGVVVNGGCILDPLRSSPPLPGPPSKSLLLYAGGQRLS